MTVVYLDAFLALNFGVNYLLLACAGRLDGEPRCRWRVALAAGLGAGVRRPDPAAWLGLSGAPGLQGRGGGGHAPGGLWAGPRSCCGQGGCFWSSPAPLGGCCCWSPWPGRPR